MKKSKILSILTVTGILTISTLGTNVNATSGKKAISVHEYLVPNKTVVTYALTNRNETLSLSDVEAEFGVKTTNQNDPVKTGDVFEKDGTSHIIINYGDVNKDGKITTADALEIQKYILGLTTLDDIQIEASNVERGGEDKITTADALAIQQFVLGKRTNETDTKTILNKYPVKDEDLIKDVNVEVQPESDTNKYVAGKEIAIAKVSSANVTKLEKYLLKNTVITSVKPTEGTAEQAKNTAHIIYEDKDGEITIKLYAVYPGEYQIQLNVQGDIVIPQGITKALDPITVAEDTEITGIELYNGSSKIESKESTLKTGESFRLTIEFNHKYYDYNDSNTVIRTKVYNDVDGVSIEQTGDACLDTKKTTLLNGESAITISTADQPATGIDVKASDTSAGKANIEFKINSSKYTTTEEINLTINVNKIIADTIIINNTRPSTAGISINLYKTYTGAPKTKEIGGMVYTILDVELKENSEHIDLICTDINKIGSTGADGNKKLVVSEKANTMSKDIDVIPLYKNGSEYEKADDPSQNVVAIGIAIKTDTDTTKSNLEQGLTIKYGEKQLPVTVKVVE